MARMCDICSRQPLQATSRSHSNIATKRRQFVNLQYKRVEGLRQRICTRCIKTLAKSKMASV